MRTCVCTLYILTCSSIYCIFIPRIFWCNALYVDILWMHLYTKQESGTTRSKAQLWDRKTCSSNPRVGIYRTHASALGAWPSSRGKGKGQLVQVLKLQYIEKILPPQMLCSVKASRFQEQQNHLTWTGGSSLVTSYFWWLQALPFLPVKCSIFEFFPETGVPRTDRRRKGKEWLFKRQRWLGLAREPVRTESLIDQIFISPTVLFEDKSRCEENTTSKQRLLSYCTETFVYFPTS